MQTGGLWELDAGPGVHICGCVALAADMLHREAPDHPGGHGAGQPGRS
jgi:hypothetical protein